MKNMVCTIVMILITGSMVFGLAPEAVRSECIPDPPPDSGYRIYYHNSGLDPYCIQDFDMDMPEYKGFLSQFAAYISPNYGVPVVADGFTGCPAPDEEPHGVIVERYFKFAYTTVPPDRVEMTGFPSWADMIQYIAGNYGRGTVVNLSNGTLGWDKRNTGPVLDAYAAGILLVGAPLTFAGAPDIIGDKVLRTWLMDGEGQFIAAPGLATRNIVAVGVCTNWRPDDNYFISSPMTGGGASQAWRQEWGSFSTPLLAGTVQYIADIVASRGLPLADHVPTVLDYVISGCDRNVDPSSYEHRLGEDLPSFGPWSDTWGYGTFSPWKSLIYAYGFGRLEAKDSALDPVGDPETVFSDHFMLRGDLFVPSDQSFRVNHLASVSIDPTAPTPEGPAGLGVYPSLHEIRVAGSMVIETSLENGVNATLVIDGGGTCTVKNGGLVTVSSGQVLKVDDGGELSVETGGQIVVEDGGELSVETGGQIVVEDGGLLMISGEFDLAGTLTVESGSQTVFDPTSNVHLSADLNIPAGAYFLGSPGCSITVASVDSAGGGSDPNRVEITCAGVIELAGNTNNAVVIKGQNTGAGTWVGIMLNSFETSGSAINYTQISDADIGLAVGGSAPLNHIVGLEVVHCGTGLKVTGRNTPSLIGNEYGGEISDCTNGVELNTASISLDGMSMHDNDVGIHATSSSPTVRNCYIYANTIGVATYDGFSIPDLGTVADPGNNDFFGPQPGYPGLANTTHILAVDPFEDIYAQKNWWGTTKQRAIQERIWVIHDSGTGDVVFVPFLTGPPVGGALSLVSKGDSPVPLLSATGMDRLGDNYPNPFNPATTIEFSIASGSHVNLSIYNVSGQLVRTLVNEFRPGNTYQEVWNGTDSRGRQVASGVYFYKLETARFRETKKLILLR